MCIVKKKGKEHDMKSYSEQMLASTLEYIKAYQRENGRSPSIRTIAKAFPNFYGSSIGRVQRYLAELTRRGQIEYDNGIKASPKYLSGKTIKAPLVGSCPCGTPMLAEENIESTYALPVELFGSTPHFLLVAIGHSMIDAGISEGDLMIVRQQNTANNGDIVIALIDDSATAKVFHKKGNKIVLSPCNDTLDENSNRIYNDIVVDSCEILGVVDKVLHTPKAR